MKQDLCLKSRAANQAGAGDWAEALPATPGFVYDERRLCENPALLDEIRSACGCRVLYSIKAAPFMGLLKRMRGRVNGFSVSSLFEARLAHEAIAGSGTLHITTPGLLREEMPELGHLCDTHFLDGKGALSPVKVYDYDDYRQQWSDSEPLRQSSKSGAG